jgi:hypothetical protein
MIQASCGGVPVYALGYTHFLAESPQLVDDARVQIGCKSPCMKVPLKKSWEISSNYLGATAPRMPRTVHNDYLPLEAIHLIDGDGQTCWCSKSQTRGDAEAVWIRLDLVAQRPITKIVLQKRVPLTPRGVEGSQKLDTDAVEIGRAMPGHLSVRLARDAMNWSTVFDGPSGDRPESNEFTITFPPTEAKQIWIVGRRLPRVENWLHGFSIAQVQVFDASGRNLALATRGTGVTVSSTMHSHGQTRDEHRWLWPIHTDLGLKWSRVGYHDDPINWHWVEKTPGTLEVDPEADASITYLVERGVQVVMALGGGNRFHTQGDPARRLPQLWEWYYENPAPPTTPEALGAWERYVRFMVRHFRDRVKHFEVWNEWNVECYWGRKVSVEDYLVVARRAIPIIRKEAPQAKVMLGSAGGFSYGMSSWSPEELARQEREHVLLRAAGELARDVDIIGYHPFYQKDPDAPEFRSYAADVQAFDTWCRLKGFGGQLMASEWTVGANYPSATPPNWWGQVEFSEMQKAKLVAQVSVLHSALGVGSFFCELWSNTYPLDLTLLRRSFAADPISPQQPQAAYYAMRNLATALEGLRPAKFSFRVTGGPKELSAFMLGRRGERVLALWRPGRPADVCEGVSCDVEIEGRCQSAQGYDCMNGTTQSLRIKRTRKATRIEGILVRDYPVLLRLR